MTESVTSGSVGGMASNGRLYPEDAAQGACRAVSGKAQRGVIAGYYNEL
jgi:hypothetical protein